MANTNIQIEVADKLSQLSVLLSSEGDSLSASKQSTGPETRALWMMARPSQLALRVTQWQQ